VVFSSLSKSESERPDSREIYLEALRKIRKPLVRFLASTNKLKLVGYISRTGDTFHMTPIPDSRTTDLLFDRDEGTELLESPTMGTQYLKKQKHYAFNIITEKWQEVVGKHFFEIDNLTSDKLDQEFKWIAETIED
jgi:hypothetical protein